MIRKANINDVKEIHTILLQYSQQGTLLGRSLSELYDQIRDFFIYVDADSEDGSVAGACALHICWDDIAEIRSLAVKEGYSGRGMGKGLVNACIEEAVELGIRKLFVLTYVPEFFEKMGFSAVDKSVLPHKVWADCINCIKFPDCDEDAMVLEIGGNSK